MRVLTDHVYPDLIDLLQRAKRFLLLVSPYWDLTDRLKAELERAEVRGVRLILIARGGTDREAQEKKLHPIRQLVPRAPILFVERLHADLASHGLDELGPAYGYVLRMLDAEPALRQADLAARLGMTRAGLGKIVDEMVKRGFLTRRSDPDDARAWALHIGPRGALLLRCARAFHARYERELADQLGESVAVYLNGGPSPRRAASSWPPPPDPPN